MRTSIICETQIVTILREANARTSVADLLRKHKGSRTTFYLWKWRYGSAGVSDSWRLKELEQENARMKPTYACQALGLSAIKAVRSRKL